MRIFVGWDSRETVAYHTLCHSIIRRASLPVSITPLKLDQLPIDREVDPLASTEFTYSRFLVPWLCGYEGAALFMDADMLVHTDILDVMEHFDPTKAVMCCQHDYTPKSTTKFLGNAQHPYPRKNWSSFMLFNNSHPDCKNLTPESVSNQIGKYLHRMEWTGEVGEIPLEWNFLVGEQEIESPKVYHYTLGTPCFCGSPKDHSHHWKHEMREMASCKQ